MASQTFVPAVATALPRRIPLAALRARLKTSALARRVTANAKPAQIPLRLPSLAERPALATAVDLVRLVHALQANVPVTSALKRRRAELAELVATKGSAVALARPALVRLASVHVTTAPSRLKRKSAPALAADLALPELVFQTNAPVIIV
ncbi:hypothetical protein C365_06845 [Cryptococcus neoformans Bt85]|nr:hypothetical protein C365_06845 [Cryptococcus neoformans var. grubii Bt85]